LAAESTVNAKIGTVHRAICIFPLFASIFREAIQLAVIRVASIQALQRGTAVIDTTAGSIIIGRTLSTDLSGKEARRSEGQLGEHA